MASTATILRRTDHSDTRKAENAPEEASRRLFSNGTPERLESNPHPRRTVSDGRAAAPGVVTIGVRCVTGRPFGKERGRTGDAP